MLITNIKRLVTMEPAADRIGALGIITDASMWIDGDKIMWMGKTTELPSDAQRMLPTALDADGGIVTPGLIDAHTHLIHAGKRVDEFVQRMRGVTYAEIAQTGGGILSTVKATREATEDALFEAAVKRVRVAMQHGTTTMEIKSGYGLDLANEEKLLRVIPRLRAEFPLTFTATCLAAHAVPPEFADRRGAYVELLCKELFPHLAKEKLADTVDVFVESCAFTPEEATTIAQAAKAHGWRVRLHVDQLNDGNGGALAAKLGAATADHLEFANDASIAAMKKSGTIAVLLPAAALTVRPRKTPPIAKFIAAEVPIVIATDYNPGTAPMLNLPLCASLAVMEWDLDPDLAWFAVTKNAARALGKSDTHGSLAPGKRADFLVVRAESEYEPWYHFGQMAIRAYVCGGEVMWES